MQMGIKDAATPLRFGVTRQRSPDHKIAQRDDASPQNLPAMVVRHWNPLRRLTIDD
jgi:hypothetical protein